MVKRSVKTPFGCKRLHGTSTWWIIVQFDALKEHPYFYVKLHPKTNVLILIDTGCGLYPADKDAEFADIRQYLEEYPVDDGRPLNPDVDEHGKKCARRKYLVITTHVHYDHIGGNGSIAKAPGARFVSSSYDIDFVRLPEARRKHALADEVGVEMPTYKIDKYASNKERLYWPLEAADNSVDLGLTILQTPGHTPDSLTVYDREERHFFTGDTFYYRRCTLLDGIVFRQPIEFCQESSFRDFWRTLKQLQQFVSREEQPGRNLQTAGSQQEVRISCAHTTAAVPAMRILCDVEQYVEKILEGGHVPEHPETIRGRDMVMYQEDGDPNLSLLAPAWFLDGHQRGLKRRKQ